MSLGSLKVRLCHTSAVLLVPLCFPDRDTTVPEILCDYVLVDKPGASREARPCFVCYWWPNIQLQALAFFKVMTSFWSFVFLAPSSSGKSSVNGIPLDCTRFRGKPYSDVFALSYPFSKWYRPTENLRLCEHHV